MLPEVVGGFESVEIFRVREDGKGEGDEGGESGEFHVRGAKGNDERGQR